MQEAAAQNWSTRILERGGTALRNRSRSRRDLGKDESIHIILADSFKISVITKNSILGWGQFAADLQLQSKARELISHATVFALTDAIYKSRG